ncbi:MAG: imidazole glycerol phosphate synthase subunit HisF [Thermoplasmatota archaeon]
MIKKRLVACLDIADGRVVKGTRFQDLMDVGDPVELAHRYEVQGADEIVFLDIAATREGRQTTLGLLERAAREVFVPLTIGGGIRSVHDMHEALRSGADKVAVNTAAVQDPAVVGEGARQFGNQCVVVAIDALRHGSRWRVVTHGGTRPTSLDVVEHARAMQAAGAGEILLTSMDRDGTATGFDLELLAAVRQAVSVPIVASGGAGSADDVRQALEVVDAALLAGTLHRGELTVPALRQTLLEEGVAVRP